jgi:formate dehydrogenase subunit gamma
MAGAAPYSDERAREIIAAHLSLEGPALPILHALQAEFGFVPDSAVKEMATALNISRAEMHGVVTFYHDFHSAPHGRHTLKICRAESCQSMGAEKQANDFLARHKLEWGQTTPDGSLTVEPVYCLGLCACAPAAMLDGELVARLDGPRLDSLIAEARR